jgi:hypothetical protein
MKILVWTIPLSMVLADLNTIQEPSKKDLFTHSNKIFREMLLKKNPKCSLFKSWISDLRGKIQDDYSSHLYSQSI